MLRRRPEAIVLSYDGHTDRTMELLGDAGIPVIELWERAEDPIAHTIGFSNRDAAAKLPRSLIGRGYRHIAFVGEADDDWTRGAARCAGWRDAMEAAGLSAHRLLKIGKPPLSIEDGAEAAPKVLAAFPDTDCILCVSDKPAFGAQSALLAAGKRVPADIGIAGFGNFEVSRFATPAITTLTVDPVRIGTCTGELIADLLNESAEPGRAARHITVEAEVTLRGSTR